MAEMMTEVEALRALVYQATELYVKGRDVTRLASMALAGRLGREVSDACLQYWGGMGFAVGQPGLPRLPRHLPGIHRRCRRDHARHHLQADSILPGKKKG